MVYLTIKKKKMVDTVSIPNKTILQNKRIIRAFPDKLKCMLYIAGYPV